MKKFVWFIFLLLMVFSFCGLAGTVFAGIVPGSGQVIEQAVASPSLTNNDIMEYSTSATMLNVLDDEYLTLRQSSGTFDQQKIIKNTKGNTTIKADGTIASEIGTVLKGPFLRL